MHLKKLFVVGFVIVTGASYLLNGMERKAHAFVAQIGQRGRGRLNTEDFKAMVQWQISDPSELPAKKQQVSLQTFTERVRLQNIDVIQPFEKFLARQKTPNRFRLHWAASAGYIDVINALIVWAKANGKESELLFAQDSAGRTALHLAAICGHNKVVEALLDAAQECGKCEEFMAVETYARQETALDLAGRNGYQKVVEILVQHAARYDEPG